MAHFGNLWLVDAAELVYKNDNVWADLSRLVVGDSAFFHDPARRSLLENAARDVRHAIEYTERSDRFPYGSDWPLVSMKDYWQFIESIIPESYHQAVIEDNAKALFAL